MVADPLPGLDIVAAPPENGVGLLPQFLGYDSRYDLPGFIFKHDPFLRWEEFLLFCEHIHHFDLVAHIIAFVFGIGNQIGHGRV